MPNFLTQKMGPLPVWAYGAGAAGGLALWYFNRQGKAASTAAPSATSQAAQAAAAQTGTTNPLLVSTGGEQLYNYSGSVTTNTSGPTPSTAQYVTVTPVFSDPTSAVVQTPTSWPGSQGATLGTLPRGSQVQITGPPVQGPSFSEGGITSAYWQPVEYNGGTGYMWAPDTQPQEGSGGGSVVGTIGGGSGPLARMGTMPRPSWVGSGAGNNLRHQSMSHARRPQRIA